LQHTYDAGVPVQLLLVLLVYCHCAEEVNTANGWQVPGETGLGAAAVLACVLGWTQWVMLQEPLMIKPAWLFQPHLNSKWLVLQTG